MVDICGALQSGALGMSQSDDHDTKALLANTPSTNDTNRTPEYGSITDSTAISNESYNVAIGNSPADPLPASQCHVFTRRYYMLIVFSMVGFMQNTIWNSFGPISKPAERVFHWEDWQISLLANWGPIAYVIVMVPMAYCMDELGLRLAVLSSAICMTIGAGLRCITFDPKIATWLINVGHFFNGVAGPVLMSGPPLLSSLWFPPNERTTATAIGAQLMNWGLAGTFIISPYVVPDTMKNHTNGSMYADIDFERTRIKYLFYGEFGMCCVVTAMVLLYFPSRPPLPPSISASIERLDFISGVKQLVKCRHFWFVATSYGIATGVYNAWTSVLDVNLAPIGVSENESGWLGFSMLVVGPVAGMVIGKYVDSIGRNLKKVIMILLVGSIAFFGAFAALCLQPVASYIGSHTAVTVLLFATAVLGSVCVMGCWALFYELSVEETYPTAEGITTGVVTYFNNVAALVFLAVPLIPRIGTAWMNWFLVVSLGLCIPLMSTVKESYKRSSVDSR